MNKKLIALFLSGVLCTLLFGHSPIVQTKPAQSAPPSKTQNSLKPIALSAKSPSDRDSFRPKDRSQSDRPYSKRDRAVIGADDRFPVLTRDYPWSAIGRIDQPKPDGTFFQCTGTLIGRDIVLTNAHCLLDEATHKPVIPRHSSPSAQAQILFKPSLIKGISLDIARVIDYQYGTKDVDTHPTEDWAILKLDQPLGDTYGYLGWRNLDFSNPKVLAAAQDRLSVVGYSSDFPTARLTEYGSAGDTAGMNEECSVEGLVSQKNLAGTLLHRCDTNPGASGGPILALFEDGNYYIVGLHSGSEPLKRSVQLSSGEMTRVINRGVPVSRWVAKAFSMR